MRPLPQKAAAGVIAAVVFVITVVAFLFISLDHLITTTGFTAITKQPSVFTPLPSSQASKPA